VSRLEKIHVQAPLTHKMMVCSAVSLTSIRFSALHLHFMCDIMYDIINVYDIIHDIYLDALLGQLPSLNGLQCWVSDPQFTSTSFTLLVNSRGRLAAAAQCHTRGHMFQKCCKNLVVFFHVPVWQRALMMA
jgi:hypothetical protein